MGAFAAVYICHSAIRRHHRRAQRATAGTFADPPRSGVLRAVRLTVLRPSYSSSEPIEHIGTIGETDSVKQIIGSHCVLPVDMIILVEHFTRVSGMI